MNVHCVAYRLALATAGAAKNLMPVNEVFETMNSLFKYYDKSTVRSDSFKDIQVRPLL